MPSTRSPILVASLITIAAVGLGCSKGPQDKLAGQWVGESIDNIPPDQEGRANGWVRATTLEFRGDKLTVAIPAEEPRTGSYKVARVNGNRIAVEVSRPNGEHDEATFVLGAENQMKWEIGNERTVRFTRVASRLDRS